MDLNFTRWILIVEDNPDDERLARRVMSLNGRTEAVETAQNGEEALALLKEKEPPVLMLLDLKLPRLSGVEVLIAVRDEERLRSIPVVILTSSDEKSDRAACFQLGCNAFMRKPMDFDEYRTHLKTMLDFWLDVNLPV